MESILNINNPPDLCTLLAQEEFEVFLNLAYIMILGRDADAVGMATYLKLLHLGYPKMEIVKRLHNSKERKMNKLAVVGMAWPIFKYSLLQFPIAGPALRFLGLHDVDISAEQNIRVLRDYIYKIDLQLRKQHEVLAHSALLLSQNSTITSTQSSSIHGKLENNPDATSDGVLTKEITREEFDGEWYLSQYRDVAKAKLDPYEHYINSGKKERRLGMRKGSGFPQLQPVTAQHCSHLTSALASWPRKPLISIIMPTFNTPELWLREAIESVINQVYPYWELCIADDSSSQPGVRAVLEEYRVREPRIKIAYRSKNGRIAAASNTALAMATGEFVALFDHDDLLEPHAIFHVAESVVLDYPDFIYSDEVLVSENGEQIIGNVFRPMFSLELLRSHPYIVHLAAFRTSILRKIGGFDESLKISQDYDLILRFVETAHHIVHIPKALYRWRTHSKSTGHAEKENVVKTSKKLISSHLQRCGEEGEVNEGKLFNFFDVRYTINTDIKVAIIIPTKNHWDLVHQCISSIQKSVFGISYDIVLIDHDSDEVASKTYFDKLAVTHKVLRYSGKFNFSAINNFAVSALADDYSHYLFCNNDIEAISPGWLDRMLEIGQKDDVGIVGAKLYYPETNIIQHAGVCVGMFGAAEHYGKFMDRDISDGGEVHPGYIGSLIVNHEVSAVTAACMLMSRRVFENVGGFDELAMVGFGDVDICLRVREAGYRIIFCANAELIHHESISRGKSTSDPHPEDSAYFLNRWQRFIDIGDPYYNPNLTLYNTFWSLKRAEEFYLCKATTDIRRSFIQSPSFRPSVCKDGSGAGK